MYRIQRIAVLISIILCGIFNFAEAQTIITFSARTDKATSINKGSITKDGITITANQGSNFLNYDEYRIYSNSTFKVSSEVGNITKVELTCVAGYGPRNFKNQKVGEYSCSGTKGTWTGNATTLSLKANGPVRITSIKVTLDKANPELSLSSTESCATLNKAYSSPVLNNPYNLPVTFSSTNEEVATVDVQTGIVTLVSAGSTNINIDFAGNENFQPAHLSYKLIVNDDYGEKNEFSKVTDASTLKAGDILIIVNEDEKVALGTKNSNNFGTVTATINNHALTADNATTITLGGTAGEWTLYTTYGYLYAASNSANQLKAESEIEQNAKAKIYIIDGNANIEFQGNNSHNLIRYNSRNDLFSCYDTNIQSDIQLYRKDSNTQANSDVTLNIGSTGYATMYYGDRNLIVPSNVDVRTYAVIDGMLTNCHTYVAGSIIPKGTAVVVKATPGNYTFKIATDTTGIFTDKSNQLRGFDEDATTTGGVKYYKLTTKNGANVGFYWGASNGSAFTIPAHKAYLAVPSGESAGAKTGYIFDSGTTGIVSIESTSNASVTKAPIYNISGKRVGKNFKGLIICNGQKYIKN